MRRFLFLLVFLLPGLFLPAQTVRLTGNFNQFLTYYVSSIDLQTGSSDVQIFDYLLECVDCATEGGDYSPPVDIDVSFKIEIQSAALGIEEKTVLAHVRTEKPSRMLAPIRLDNRDFTVESDRLYDIYGRPVDVNIEIIEQLPDDMYNDMFTAIVQTARLPEGVYEFTLNIEAGIWDYEQETWDTEYVVDCSGCSMAIEVTVPATLQLTSPGGPFDDLENNAINTLYPVFQWESEMYSPAHVANCPECGFFIRVAEFLPEEHATPEDAIDDLATLPLDQTKWGLLVGDANGNGLWETSEVAGNQLSFIYPTSDVIDLHPGGIYVWQIQKRIITTEGIEVINSPIYAFYTPVPQNPVMDKIRLILGDEKYDAYFKPPGPLFGFTSKGVFKVDEQQIDSGTLDDIVASFMAEVYSIISEEIE